MNLSCATYDGTAVLVAYVISQAIEHLIARFFLPKPQEIQRDRSLIAQAPCGLVRSTEFFKGSLIPAKKVFVEGATSRC